MTVGGDAGGRRHLRDRLMTGGRGRRQMASVRDACSLLHPSGPGRQRPGLKGVD